ncbi:UvrD-helicase domain-containing protein [Patescibacteria group bacterium]|nr:UvrD-helicase domain-containing protein [Patescibacteria group bacterium]
MSKSKTELNENQLKAVHHKFGPILVVAGAGTGKTRVITERIKHLIQDKNINPQEILALTFTEKASHEMVERVGDIMPLGYEEPWIYTFHAFAERVLKEKGIEIGLDPSYKTLPDSDQWLLLRKNIFNMDLKYFRPLGNPTKFISDILTFISKLQDENISNKDFETFVKHMKHESDEEKLKYDELSYIYNEYERLKIENSGMDFGNLIMWVIKLFKERPNILSEYQKQFKHILVDEFQDTNYAQYELIKLLYPIKECKKENLKEIPDQRSLLVVGDDSQSIYKFRGAAISNILQFMEDYKKAETVTLIENYRSTQEILNPAYKLIQNNNPDTLESKLGISKELVSMVMKEKNSKVTKTNSSVKRAELKLGARPNPKIIRAETLEDEVNLVVSKIIEILAKEPQYTFKDISILARANNHLDPFMLSLRKYGIPYQLVGNRGLYDRDEVRDILAFLKIIIDTKEGISLFRVLNIDSLEIPYQEISNLLSQARYKKVELWEQVKESKNENVQNLVKTVEEFQKNITKQTPTEMAFNLVNSINYLGMFLEEETQENELCIKNLNLLLKRIQKFEIDWHDQTKEMPTIVDLVDYFDMIIEAGENPAQAEIEDIDTVNLMTVHSAKGLEFPVVFMVNLVSGRFPTKNRGDTLKIPDELIKETLPTGDEHIQEERRLFYVGMTRAKKYLYLTLSKNYGGKRDTIPCGFLNETGIELKDFTTEELAKLPFPSEVKKSFTPKIRKISELKGNKLDHISYSQIDNYLICPLRYKYSYVLNIPTPPSRSLNFGDTFHKTLNEFHTKMMIGNKPSLEDLYEIFEKNWNPLGYENEKDRKNTFEEGKVILKRYYEKNQNLDVKHLGLEKKFVLHIDGTKLKGTIDRIDKLPDGSVEIIDYKTGKEKSQKEVDDNVQMTIYTMGATDALKIKPDVLSLYFLNTGNKISTKRTQKQVEAQREIIKDVIKNINEENFEPNPGRDCMYCDFKDICPFAKKE